MQHYSISLIESKLDVLNVDDTNNLENHVSKNNNHSDSVSYNLTNKSSVGYPLSQWLSMCTARYCNMCTCLNNDSHERQAIKLIPRLNS